MCEGQKINGRRAKAYTVTWMKANLPDRQDYMQLCPWWLDEVSQQEHLMSNLPPDSEIKNTDFPYRDPSQEMPWMDIYMPVEQSLVHEVLITLPPWVQY